VSYYTTLEGEITINPAMPWGTVKNLPFLEARKDMDLAIVVTEEPYEDNEGTHIRKTGTSIVSAWSGESVNGNRHVQEQLQQIVDAAVPRTGFDGVLTRFGERRGDVIRYRVVDGKAVEEKAVVTLTWPDGSTEVM